MSGRRKGVVLNVSNCKYDVVRRVGARLGFFIDEDVCSFDSEDGVERDDWNVLWTDTSVSTQRAMDLKRFQRLNHFPGMYVLARKGELGRNLQCLRREFPVDFNFFPQTWVLPSQWADFKDYIDSGKGNRTFIVKPDASCQGKGIFLTRTYENIDGRENQVAQRYIHKPLLIDGFKFDMRLYVLVTSVDPLRIFLFHDGLIRICTEEYVEPKGKNLQKSCVHLTNYAINKSNKNFVFNSNSEDDGVGNKRSLLWFWEWLENRFSASVVDNMVSDIQDMVVKTLIAVQPTLNHTYKSCVRHKSALSCCFEILGFDVMIDRNFKPWLIEVNHSPSFACDTPLDRNIKEELIEKTLLVVNVSANDKKKARREQKSDSQSRLYQRDRKKSMNKEIAKRDHCENTHTKDGVFTRIYPPEGEDSDRYEKYLATAHKVFQKKSSTRRRLSRPVPKPPPPETRSVREDPPPPVVGRKPRKKTAKVTPTSQTPVSQVDLNKYKEMGKRRKKTFQSYVRKHDPRYQVLLFSRLNY